MITRVRDKEYDSLTGLNQLQQAVYLGRLDEVKYMIEDGHIQNVNYPEKFNTITALDIAINERYHDIKEYLLSKGGKRFFELSELDIYKMNERIDEYNMTNDYLDPNYKGNLIPATEELVKKEEELEEEDLNSLDDQVETCYNKFVTAINEEIKKSKRTKKDLAVILNIDFQRLSHITTGNRPMTGKEMVKLAIFFGINLTNK